GGQVPPEQHADLRQHLARGGLIAQHAVQVAQEARPLGPQEERGGAVGIAAVEAGEHRLVLRSLRVGHGPTLPCFAVPLGKASGVRYNPRSWAAPASGSSSSCSACPPPRPPMDRLAPGAAPRTGRTIAFSAGEGTAFQLMASTGAK